MRFARAQSSAAAATASFSTRAATVAMRTPKKSESHTLTRARLDGSSSGCRAADDIAGFADRPAVHTSEVLAHHSERKELRAREDGDDRREEREPLDDHTVQQE